LKGTTLITDLSQPVLEKISASSKGAVISFDSYSKKIPKNNVLSNIHLKNTCALLALSDLLGFPEERSLSSFRDFERAYGRGECIQKKGIKFTIHLAKNPASFDSNLRELIKTKDSFDSILFILNDNIPDGRDVSWIYDISPELLSDLCKSKRIHISGSRFLDMAVRLTYARVSVDSDFLDRKLSKAINRIRRDSNNSKVIVLPTYSGMLQVRKILTGKSIL